MAKVVDHADDDDDYDVTSLKEIAAAGAPGVNDSQVITQIVEEYDQRLQAQLALAKEDIVNALEEQIQVGAVAFSLFFLFRCCVLLSACILVWFPVWSWCICSNPT